MHTKGTTRCCLSSLYLGLLLGSLATTAPATQTSSQELRTRTITPQAANTSLPLLPGREAYKLLGCYSLPPPDVPGGALGNNGNEYILLHPVTAENFTVSACLKGCATSTPVNETRVHYSYAAVGAGRRVIQYAPHRLQATRLTTLTVTAIAEIG
jgi:hypothetical protein